MTDETELEKQLRNWRSEVEPKPEFQKEVMLRIDAERQVRMNRLSWLQIFMGGLRVKPVGAFAALLVLGLGLIIGYSVQFWSPYSTSNVLAYRALIDPVARVSDLSPVEATPGDDTLLSSLRWIQRSLDLEREQFEALVRIHLEYETEFIALAVGLSKAHSKYRDFEGMRMADEMIDFIAFYELLEETKDLEMSSRKRSSALVESVLEILNPSQKAVYLALITSSSVEHDA